LLRLIARSSSGCWHGLFGHERGRLPGRSKPENGRLVGDRGTLFLDEVRRYSAGVAAKLLAVWKEPEIRAVCSNRTPASWMGRWWRRERGFVEAVGGAGVFSQRSILLGEMFFDKGGCDRERRPRGYPVLVRYFVQNSAGGRLRWARMAGRCRIALVNLSAGDCARKWKILSSERAALRVEFGALSELRASLIAFGILIRPRGGDRPLLFRRRRRFATWSCGAAAHYGAAATGVADAGGSGRGRRYLLWAAAGRAAAADEEKLGDPASRF